MSRDFEMMDGTDADIVYRVRIELLELLEFVMRAYCLSTSVMETRKSVCRDRRKLLKFGT